MEQCQAPELLREFAARRMTPENIEEMSHHVANCLTCQHRLELLYASLARRSSTIEGNTSDPQKPASTTDLSWSQDRRQMFPPAAAASGQLLANRYRLEGQIASGGMGIVHRATDILFAREVAIKVLRPRWEAEPNPDRQDYFRRRAIAAFQYEAGITARLQHPGIPAVHEIGTLPDGLPFLAMKLIRGQTLQALLEARKRPEQELARWLLVFEQIAQAVGYANSQGVLHRDLKPLNVMVGAFGEVQVMDWGLAKLIGNQELAGVPSADDRQFVSQAGEVKGTISYMAPEQARGENELLDARTDVFGLGAILCQILIGRPPYVGASVDKLRAAAASGNQLATTIEQIRACGADPEIIELAAQCLALHPQDRPGNGEAVAQAVAAHRASIGPQRYQAEIESAIAAVQDVAAFRQRRLAYCLVAALFCLALLSVRFAIHGWR